MAIVIYRVTMQSLIKYRCDTVLIIQKRKVSVRVIERPNTRGREREIHVRIYALQYQIQTDEMIRMSKQMTTITGNITNTNTLTGDYLVHY